MTVTALLISHDGARWLPAVLAGLGEQTRVVDRVVALDTTSRDGSRELLEAALGAENVHLLPGSTHYPAAVQHALAQAPAVEGDEWIWLLHDDSNPAPDALAQLLAAAAQHPQAQILGPKLREWPSLRRLLEVGLTITGTGRRETGLEPGEYDQGQHDEVRPVLAVNTAGMLVRRRVLEELGGLDPELPIFGNDIDFGWRAAKAGHQTLVVPQAVVFHAEAAHRGLRRTPLTGRHTHYQERRAALFTSLANVSTFRLPWQFVRLFFGSLLRMLGFFAVRSVGEALDELAAVLSVCGRPGQLREGRRARAARRSGTSADVRPLLAPAWLPYRHGLDFLSDLASAATSHAADVAERRRAAKEASGSEPTPGSASVSSRTEPGQDDDDDLLTDSGMLVRFLTNPVALTLVLAMVLSVVAARDAFGSISGGALSPVPVSTASWWHLHLDSWHALGSGTDVPAPAYILPFAMLASLFAGSPGAVISALMLLAVPLAALGAWRLLDVVSRLVDPRGAPRWLLAWGALSYGLVPATSGAWGAGRFGVVAVAVLLPWVGRAALGFVDPEADRRWRAAWRSGLLLALGAAFVPGLWLFALLATALVLGAAARIAPGLLRDRDAWGPPVLAVGLTPLLLIAWFLPLLTTGSASGLLLEAGRLSVDQVGFQGLLTGRLSTSGAPWQIGAVTGALAVLALLSGARRIPVLVCWLVALPAAVVCALLAQVSLSLAGAQARPSLGLFVVILQGLAVVAFVLGAPGIQRATWPTGWQRGVSIVIVVIAALVPIGGLGWWLSGPDNALANQDPNAIPAYMEQSSLLGAEHGVLVLNGSIANGIDYRIRRDDGITVGEDEILALTEEDTALTGDIEELLSAPTPELVAALADRGIEYVVLAAPADGVISARLDATAGLDQASAEDRATRAWRGDRQLDPNALVGERGWLRTILLTIQAAMIVVALVLAAPTVRGRRDD